MLVLLPPLRSLNKQLVTKKSQLTCNFLSIMDEFSGELDFNNPIET